MIFCPTLRLHTETRKRIFAQNYHGYVDIVFSKDNPYGQWSNEAYRNVQLNYEKMRRMALSEKYSAVWCIEDDMLPPLDALTKLVSTMKTENAGIVSGLYVLRHGSNSPNLMQYGQSVEIGSSMRWEVIKGQIEHGATIIPISGGCQGCLLIRHDVLEGFSFLRESKGAPDMDFMRYCFQAGIKQVARLDVICGHIESDGTVLRPEAFL